MFQISSNLNYFIFSQISFAFLTLIRKQKGLNQCVAGTALWVQALVVKFPSTNQDYYSKFFIFYADRRYITKTIRE